MIASVLGPVLFGFAMEQTEHVRMAAFGAFQVSLVNVQGLYRDRSRTKVITLLLLIGMLVWVNVIHGYRLAELLSMFSLMLLVGRAAAFGPTAISLGLSSGVAYIVMGALYSNLGWSTQLFQTVLEVAAGGAWAVTIHYLYWALRPGTPLAQKVSDLYLTLAASVERNGPLEGQWPPQGLSSFEAVDSALLEARSMWSSARSYRHGSSPRHLQLLTLIESADALREQISLVIEGLNHLWGNPTLKPAQPLLAKAWEQLALAFRSVPSAVSRHHRPVDLSQLQSTLLQLDQVREQIRQDVLETVAQQSQPTALSTIVVFRGVVEAMQKSASELQRVSETACSLLPRPTWDRFWKTTPMSQWNLSGHKRRAFRMRSLRSLKTLTTLDRHAVRFATIVMIGSQVGTLSIFHQGYWVPLHIALVLKPDYGSTAERSLERTSGTIWGSALGMALIALKPGPVLLWFLLLLLLFCALTVRPASYSWFVALITPAVVLLIELTTHQGWAVGVDRILSTVAGVALALLGVALLFPKWERNNFSQQLERALLSHKALFERVVKSYLNPSIPQSAGQAGALRFRATADTAQLSAMARRALREPLRLKKSPEAVTEIVSQMHRLISSIAALAYYQGQFGWRYHSEAFAAYCEEVSQILGELALSVREKRPPNPCRDLDTTLKTLRENVRQLQAERADEYSLQPSRMTQLAQAVREQTPVFTQLERIAEELSEMSDSVLRLYPLDKPAFQPTEKRL